MLVGSPGCSGSIHVLPSPPHMGRNPVVGVRFDPSELELLEAIAAHEERSRADVVRRAVRAYAEKLGVKVKPAKGPKK